MRTGSYNPHRIDLFVDGQHCRSQSNGVLDGTPLTLRTMPETEIVFPSACRPAIRVVQHR
jgi:hypothetical protein